MKSGGDNFLYKGKQLFPHNLNRHKDPKIMKRIAESRLKELRAEEDNDDNVGETRAQVDKRSISLIVTIPIH